MSLRTEEDESSEEFYSSPKRSHRSAMDRQGLSSDELKLRLLQTVKNKGIYDSMKVNDREKEQNWIYIILFFNIFLCI